MTIASLDSWVKVAQITQGFLTPVIAFGIGVITYRIQRQQTRTQQQQAKTNHLQHRLALMERRMKVFNGVLEFISLVIREGKVSSLESVFKLAGQTRESYLLFGPEIREYIDELSGKGVELNTIDFMRSPEGDVKPFTDTLQWFAGQMKVAEQKFLKYIDFREP